MEEELKFEVNRQLFHLTLGVTIAAAVWTLKPVYGTLILAPLIIAVTLMRVVPLASRETHIDKKLIRHFEREKDRKTFPFKGAIMYGIGIFPAILFLETSLACAIIMVLSVGDSFSTIIGKSLGRVRIGSKSLEGFLACTITGFIGASLFTGQAEAAFLAVLGAIVELQETFDDNVAIPWTLTVAALVFSL